MYLRNAYEETTKNFNLNYLYFQFLENIYISFTFTFAYLKRNAVIIPDFFRIPLRSRLLVFRFLQGPTRVLVFGFLQGPGFPVFVGSRFSGFCSFPLGSRFCGLCRVPLGSRFSGFCALLNSSKNPLKDRVGCFQSFSYVYTIN